MSQEYRVPENVTRVEKVRHDIRKVVIHDRVTDIASDAFRGWAGLEEVVFKGRSSLERIGSHAFAGTGLEKFIAPGSLKKILGGAFAGCKSLKEVRLNEGLESLGEGVFQDSGVETVYIPSTLQRMRKDAFAGCESLRRVEVAEGCKLAIRYYLPQNVEVVTVPVKLQPAENEPSSDFDEDDLDDTMMLQENEEVQEMGKIERKQQVEIERLGQQPQSWSLPGPAPTLPELPTYVPEYDDQGVEVPGKQPPRFGQRLATAEQCASKKHILEDPNALVISDGTNVINEQQLKERQYRSVFIPKSVIAIQNRAFANWKHLQRVVFEEGSELRVIGQVAFVDCSSLEDVRLPDGLREIGIGAFGGSRLRSVIIPSSVRTIHQCAFDRCEKLTYVVINEGLEVLGVDEYTNDGGDWCGAFCNSALEYIELPSTLKRIKYKTFWGCKNLKSINLPESLEYIGEYCFCGSALESVVLPSSLKTIEDAVFFQCGNLKNVVFPDALEKIGLFAFSKTGLENVKLPASLRQIFQGAFAECECLKTVEFGEGLEILGTDTRSEEGETWSGVFYKSALEKVRLPSTLKRIECRAFCCCTGLKSIELPDSLERIEGECFCGSGIEEITIPKSAKHISADAFRGCENIQKIYVEDCCEADFRLTGAPDSTKIGPLPETRAGNEKVWSLRDRKHVVIPAGVGKIGNNWFRDSDIESVAVPASVKEIGDNAFRECKNLRQITFAEGSQLETIGENCFYRSGIEEITLPSMLKEVGEGAFCSCKSLKTIRLECEHEIDLVRAGTPSTAQIIFLSVTLPGGVRLQDLYTMKDAIIPDGVERIENYWFWNSGIGSVTIPASVSEIGTYAFYNCTSLRHITFKYGSRLEKIGPKSFYNAGIEKIVIPNTVEEIQEDAFYSCETLKEVIFQEGSKLKKIEQACFSDTEIEKIVIPKNVMQISDKTFQQCGNLREVAFEEGSKLKTIGQCVFDGCSSLVKIDLPQGLKSIEDCAFSDCESLKHIQLPDGLEKIGEMCFSFSCLEKIVLPASVKEVDINAFEGCDNLQKIYVERGCEASLSLTGVPESAEVGPLPEAVLGSLKLWDLREFKHVTVPDGIEKIGKCWFWGSKIESVTIPARVKEICANSFRNCRNLQKVTFAERSKLKTIGEYAFHQCNSLAKINLPDGLEKIGAGCFSESGLEEIIFPESVKEIDEWVFKDCKQLEKVQLNEGLEKLGEVGFACSGIHSIRLPSTLKRIETWTFSSCKNLKNIKIPNGVECIGDGCFSCSDIEEITLPSTLKEIGENAFEYCENLRTVFVEEGCAVDVRMYVSQNVEVRSK